MTSIARRWLLGFGAVSLAGVPAAAQDADELEPVSAAVVQPLPNQGSMRLNAALNRLALNPRDIYALLEAGNAALALGDTEAALGFFGRADQLSPGNPQIKAALAGAMVRNEDPFAAIPMFEAAERAGARDPLLAGERGLAYDLVGDNLSAQRYYRQALAAVPGNDEIARRLALSLAVAGDRKGSEATLLPQIRRNDRAAWRTRAFALAILGDTEEAVRIANGTMPRELAASLIPYLRYMARLTPAQQAAAANFGHFPRAAQIGRDDPRVARYAALNPRSPAPVAAAAKTDASKKARGSREERRRNAASARPVQTAARVTATPTPTPVATPEPAPVQRPPVRVAAATINPNVASRAPDAAAVMSVPIAAPAQAQAQPPAPASTGPAPAPTPAAMVPMPGSAASSPPPNAVAVNAVPAATGLAAPAQVTASSGASAIASYSLPASNLDLARRTQEAGAPPAAASTAPSPLTTEPSPAAAEPPAVAPRADFASAFGDFRPPADEQAAAGVGVDLAAIEKARAARLPKPEERGPLPDAPKDTRRIASAEPALAKPAAARNAKAGAKLEPAKAKPAMPSHPSRIWVQIGVGRDKGALGFDWRKFQRTKAELFKSKKAWTTPWGQTNRLLVGPFETQAAAQGFLKAARKETLDAFLWTSPAGQAIDALAVR